jgi:hypothetical protein
VSLDEFATVILQAEEILRGKIMNSKQIIGDFKRQRKEALEKLDEIRRTEILNEYQIMDGSLLTVTLLEGKGLVTRNENLTVFGVLKCGTSRFQTTSLRSANPVWKENFSL